MTKHHRLDLQLEDVVVVVVDNVNGCGGATAEDGNCANDDDFFIVCVAFGSHTKEKRGARGFPCDLSKGGCLFLWCERGKKFGSRNC